MYQLTCLWKIRVWSVEVSAGDRYQSRLHLGNLERKSINKKRGGPQVLRNFNLNHQVGVNLKRRLRSIPRDRNKARKAKGRKLKERMISSVGCC